MLVVRSTDKIKLHDCSCRLDGCGGRGLRRLWTSVGKGTHMLHGWKRIVVAVLTALLLFDLSYLALAALAGQLPVSRLYRAPVADAVRCHE